MNRFVLGVLGAAIFGCGPSYEGQGAKTPDEILAEQEALAAEQEKLRRDPSDYAEVEATDEEKKRAWDEHYAELELKRAARSAETCPESVTEKAPKGKARVTLVFRNDGHVREARIGDPYTETVVGKCVLRAMEAVIVRPYEGPEKTVEWDIDLTGEKKSGPASSG
ncbi:MAG TPA: hypothetical protein VKY73_23975 [Polyangiaceae bacterium]|nr:hypothetical protein [Polyangiaceae bacterium]